MSPHKDANLIKEDKPTTNEEVIQGIDSLLWQSTMSPKWIPCKTTMLRY